MLKVNTEKISIKDFAHKYDFGWLGRFWLRQAAPHGDIDVDDFYPIFAILPKNGEIVLCNTTILDGGDVDTEGRYQTMGDCAQVLGLLFDMISNGDLVKE